MRSSSPYHPHGASIFPFHQERIRTKETELTKGKRNKTKQNKTNCNRIEGLLATSFLRQPEIPAVCTFIMERELLQ